MAEHDRNLAEMLSLSDDDSDAILRTAVEAYSAGDFSRAETTLVGLITINASDVRPVKLLASCLQLQDRHSEAEAVYERALTLDPDDPYTMVALAEIRLKNQKVTEALELFEKLFALDPNRRNPAANRGRQVVKEYHAKVTEPK